MNQNNLIDVIIPVAGKGERFYPITKYTQKCLLPVGDKPILGHILSRIQSLNIKSVKLITGHFENKVKEYVENYKNLNIACIYQSEQLGLAHAIKLGLQNIENPVLIILGDSIFDIDYVDFCNKTKSNIGVLEVEDPERYGIIELDQDKIIKFIEKPKNPKSNLAQIGIYYIHSQKKLLNAINKIITSNIQTKNEYQLPDAFQIMIKDKNMFEYTKINEYLDCGIKKNLLASNKKIFSSMKSSNFISLTAQVINSNLKYCHISPGCIIENSSLKNVIVLNDTLIKNKILENEIIGS
ncbi:MAG: hypothetical protein CMG07_04510 [Candidatus Marinimicrobia bacterium]|nr:hypothetical protein [Candidatus Neomarinimicrobiota bacterium]